MTREQIEKGRTVSDVRQDNTNHIGGPDRGVKVWINPLDRIRHDCTEGEREVATRKVVVSREVLTTRYVRESEEAFIRASSSV